MFLEQVLHIMLNQDKPRSCVFFRPQIYVFLYYPILGKMENMWKKLCKRLHRHRLSPLNNARFPMSYAKILFGLTSCIFSTISRRICHIPHRHHPAG